MVIPFLKTPALAIVYLQNPRERFWGVVLALDATGLMMQGTDLDSFDSWVGQVVAGDQVGATTVFFPMLRVEKVFVDTASGAAPSLGEQFQRRVGRSVLEYFGGVS